jgi:tRNA pseudouridine13 synthase
MMMTGSPESGTPLESGVDEPSRPVVVEQAQRDRTAPEETIHEGGGAGAHAPPPPLAPLEMRIDDPLPHEYITTDRGVGGAIKRRAEDFLVDEIPLYEPEGRGEHLYVCVQKTNTSHNEMISVVRRHFGVESNAIGFAGMKDKVGVTRQTLSIHLPGVEVPDKPIDHRRIAILWSARHGNKLRLGHLAGNRFSIRIRDVDPMRAPAAGRILRQMERFGVPNYFGAQRFGYRGNNHVLGAYVLLGQWRDACTFLLGTAAKFPEYQRPKRELYDAGRYEEAQADWTTADRTEHIVAKKLARGYRPRDAVLAVGQTALEFWTSSLQSAIFNRVLDQRIRSGRFATLVEGDVACKHDNRAMFPVTAEEIASGELPARLEAMEISPTGPLWGGGMMLAGGDIAEVEREALAAAGFSVDQFLAFKRCPPGQRRPLSVPLKNTLIESGLDEYGEFIRVAFDLPRGSYATVVLREIMKSDSIEVDDVSTA